MADQVRTNPDVGKPAVIEKPKTATRAKAKTRFGGDTLVPGQGQRQLGSIKSYWYWVGVTPGCPRAHVDLAGVNFPKVNELLIKDRMGGSMKQRVPVIGALVKLTETKIRAMAERLPRTVIRFYDDQGTKEEPGTGQNVGDNHVQARRGQLITIPTAEEIAQRRASGKPTREYVEDKRDVAAAHYMFAQLCDDQEKGSRSDVYPPTLQMAGLEWPDALADETADLLG